MMKKILLVASILTASVVTYSQLELNGTTDIITGQLTVAEDSELDVAWDVINAGSTTLTLRAYRNVMQEVSGSSNHFCWGILCYGSSTDTSSANANLMVTMAPNHVESTFHGFYFHYGTAGHTMIEYCFFDNNDPEIKVCHVVNYCIDDACIIGVNESEFEVTLGQVSPNPVSSRGIIEYSLSSLPENARVVIHNLIGDVVKEIKLDNKNGVIFIDAADFNAGVYFYTLEGNGTVFATKKLVISR